MPAAIAEAGRRRLRPILMPTLTTELALVPLAITLLLILAVDLPVRQRAAHAP